jgi:hypothetical protein
MDATVGPTPLDAGPDTMDATAQKPGTADCTVDATPYTCACAANPASCAHPLAGRYAVRTVSYARQKTIAAGAVVDVVSKGVLLSVADISPTGVVKEHLCLLELINPDGMYSWVTPAGTQRIPDSSSTLEERNGGFVRPLAGDKINVSWSPTKQPADCTPGTTHSSGCLCFDANALPSDPKDCRVTDLDEDGTPGLKLSVNFERPVDPATATSLLNVSIAGVKAVEWRLPGTAKGGAGEQLVGGVEGSVSQNQLSVQGELAAEIGKVQSATCASDSAHVELVRGDFDCAAVMAGRAKDLDSHGIFHPALDAVRPEPTSCPDPDCAVDSDRDGTPDCKDLCPLDAAKLAPGICKCGAAEADINNDLTIDCGDLCPNDPAKTAPGVCDCGTPDVDLNKDGIIDMIDCRGDLCPDDPAKTAPGVCDCGTPDVDLNNDSIIDMIDCNGDLCPDDPAKVVPGVCGCGVPESACAGMLGTYAVRTVIHGRQRLGNDAPTTSRAIGYALVTVTSGATGTLTVSEKTCWLQTLPNPNESGIKVYTWSKPEWVQATPATERTATINARGAWTATSASTPFGWDPARQPANCTARSTPPAPWNSSWGATCTCQGAANTLPPYDRDEAPYDCRLIDQDGDGLPGLSAIVATSAPSSPRQNAGSGPTSATAFAVTSGNSQWTLTPATDRRHTGTITDNTSNAIVGCTGGGCSFGLSATSPTAAACPARLNTVQFIPVTGGTDSCDEIVAQRESLFNGPIASWTEAAACPSP